MSDEPEDEMSCGVCGDENPHFAAGDRWMLGGALNVAVLEYGQRSLETGQIVAIPPLDFTAVAERKAG